LCSVQQGWNLPPQLSYTTKPHFIMRMKAMFRRTVSAITIAILLMSTLMLAFDIQQARASGEPPPTEWTQPYGGTDWDCAQSVVQADDGGYVMAGTTKSYGAGGYDFWLVKTNANGNIQWSERYGGTNDEMAYSLIRTSDGGYAIAGWTTSYGAGSSDVWLVKTDANGNMLWSSAYGGTAGEIGRSVVQTSDGGYAIAGFAYVGGMADFFLVKAYANGVKDWSKNYGGDGWTDRAYSVVQTSDGGYALAGLTDAYGAGLQDGWLVKTDSSGNKQWSSPYGGVWGDVLYSVVQTGDGGYALAGETYSYDASGSSEGWLVKTGATGNMQWSQTYGMPVAIDIFSYSLVQTSDGGYALAGEAWNLILGDPNYGKSDCWLAKTDAGGNLQWNKTDGGTGQEYAYSLVQTSDGGYALAGETNSVGAGNYDFWLVKVAPSAGPSNNAPYTPYSPSPSNHASGVPVTQVLSWSGGDPDAGDTVTYDVYFGRGSSPPLVSSSQSSTIYNPGTLSYAAPYYWKIVATDSHGASTSGPTWDFVSAHATLTDGEKQQNLLTMVNSHKDVLPPELVLGVIRTEAGVGAFHVDGWNYNSFYRQLDGPWAQPTNGDGIMQVTSASGYHERSGIYTNDQEGNNHAINDGCDYLLKLYHSYGSYVQIVLHYNTGPSSLYIYLGKNWGDRNYLSHVAEHMTNFVPNIYGLQNPSLINTLSKGQSILNRYLYDKGIKTGQSVDYYSSYQKQLDGDLRSIELIALAGETKMRVSVFECPVNVTVSDEYDRIISEVESQIPGAIFEYFNATDTKIFYLPLNLTYYVQVDATDSGNITISQIIPLESIYELAFSCASFNLTSETAAEFDLLPYEANCTVRVDENGDGVFDYELIPETETMTIEYDLGLTQIAPSKTVVEQGSSLPINVTVVNYGVYAETFNVTLCANDTIIGWQTITLTNGTAATITFTWNTGGFGKGNYTIQSYAGPVPGETNTYDNGLALDTVRLSIPGDVDGDFDVDILDVVKITGVYGSKLGDPNFSPNSDINDDGQITILDVVIWTGHYGEKWP
jgi:hypothetical protein